MRMKTMMSTKEVAQFLNVNEKMVYTLVAEKGLPATKVTGKWLFPRQLVEQWVETHTVNYPQNGHPLPPYHGLLILAGSNDPLLEKTITLYNERNPGHIAVFGNIGSMGGLQALRQELCHIASSHLLQEDDHEYNFDFAAQELDKLPAVINFCRREQGLVVQRGNPKNISHISALGQGDIRIVNRPLGTGTRLLLDLELKRAGINGAKIDGYGTEMARHLDVGLEVLSGRADAGLAIRTIADLLAIEFVPVRWERYDLMINKDRFFEEGIQRFLGLLHDKRFRQTAASLTGYNLDYCGKMIFPSGLSQRSGTD
jgi:excisionase family DNA binding protein